MHSRRGGRRALVAVLGFGGDPAADFVRMRIELPDRCKAYKIADQHGLRPKAIDIRPVVQAIAGRLIEDRKPVSARRSIAKLWRLHAR